MSGGLPRTGGSPEIPPQQNSPNEPAGDTPDPFQGRPTPPRPRPRARVGGDNNRAAPARLRPRIFPLNESSGKKEIVSAIDNIKEFFSQNKNNKGRLRDYIIDKYKNDGGEKNATCGRMLRVIENNFNGFRANFEPPDGNLSAENYDRWDINRINGYIEDMQPDYRSQNRLRQANTSNVATGNEEKETVSTKTNNSVSTKTNNVERGDANPSSEPARGAANGGSMRLNVGPMQLDAGPASPSQPLLDVKADAENLERTLGLPLSDLGLRLYDDRTGSPQPQNSTSATDVALVQPRGGGSGPQQTDSPQPPNRPTRAPDVAIVGLHQGQNIGKLKQEHGHQFCNKSDLVSFSFSLGEAEIAVHGRMYYLKPHDTFVELGHPHTGSVLEVDDSKKHRVLFSFDRSVVTRKGLESFGGLIRPDSLINARAYGPEKIARRAKSDKRTYDDQFDRTSAVVEHQSRTALNSRSTQQIVSSWISNAISLVSGAEIDETNRDRYLPDDLNRVITEFIIGRNHFGNEATRASITELTWGQVPIRPINSPPEIGDFTIGQTYEMEFRPHPPNGQIRGNTLVSPPSHDDGVGNAASRDATESAATGSNASAAEQKDDASTGNNVDTDDNNNHESEDSDVATRGGVDLDPNNKYEKLD